MCIRDSPIAEIAEMLDKGCTTIKGALNELDAAGLLERRRAGFSCANRLYVKGQASVIMTGGFMCGSHLMMSLIAVTFIRLKIRQMCIRDRINTM